MRTDNLNRRLNALEGLWSASRPCTTCNGAGVDRIVGMPNAAGPRPSAGACPECGQVPLRQHVVVGVTQQDLDELFRPAPPREVGPYRRENCR
jgi:hypothetical protein